MKYLKSNARDLRELFEQSISTQYIAEPLASFDADTPVDHVFQFMNERDFDVIGVRENGLVVGYAKRDHGLGGALRDHLVSFDSQDLFDNAAPLLKVFTALVERPYVFVLVLGEIGGIVTRGDLQKAPIRMWLFGLISLIEMQLLRIIRELYPAESWKTHITEKRLTKAIELFDERKRRNENVDLAECLQLTDKRDVLLKSDAFLNAMKHSSKRAIRELIKGLEKLRNRLAHAQDIVSVDWRDTISLAEHAEEFLIAIEKFEAVKAV